MNCLFRVFKYPKKDLPKGVIYIVREPLAVPPAPSVRDVMVDFVVTNLPYADIAAAKAVFERIVEVPVNAAMAEPEMRMVHERRFVLDPTKAEPHTLVELTEKRICERAWVVIRPAIIDQTTGAIATDEALRL